MKKTTIALVTILLFIGCTANLPKEKVTVHGAIGEKAMVVTAHPLATKIGVDILKEGGNAVDAAVAVQFALAVVYPYAGNIGGGGFMVYRDNKGLVDALDFREMAPEKASRDMYLDSTGNVIENLSVLGHLACGVPGSVDGMVEAHKKYGSLPWEKLVQPAIELAINGFSLTAREAEGLNKIQETLAKTCTLQPDNLTGEWKEGDSIYHNNLGATLELIRDRGRSGFYQGRTAQLILEEMNRGNGIISLKDLDNYHSVWREPIVGTYRGYKIITMPPPSSGGVALIQLLHSVEQHNVSEFKHNSADYIHLLTEAERRVYADRASYLGDPDFYRVPVDELTDPVYNLQRMESFNPFKATPSATIDHGELLLEHNETTHYSIVDELGNAVSVTTTLNGAYGSKVVVGQAGFFLNNEMDDFSIKPGVPNMFGLIGGKANEIAPGKRMLSSMTPTIIEKDGVLNVVLGTPGGATIITSVFQTILNVIDFKMTMQEAVEAKRVHSQWFPDEIKYEEGALTKETMEKLEQMGHKLVQVGNLGKVDAVKVHSDNMLEGGADPRGDDFASGY